MSKIKLSIKAKIEIEDNGKVVKTFNVNFKELTRKQQKNLGKDNKEILEVFGKSQSLAKKAEALENKMHTLKDKDDKPGLLTVSNKLEVIYDEQDSLEEKFEALGGIDKLYDASKLTYDATVSGKDKASLAEFAENDSEYGVVLQALRDDVKEQKGKSV